VTPRSLALILGLVYLGLGALGLMPGVLAGLFPANPILAVVHLALGAWGLAAYSGRAAAPAYARRAALIFAVLALAGMLHGLERFPMPLDGANVWLHLASAALAGFVAWGPRTGERRSLAGDRRRSPRGLIRNERRNGADERRKEPAAA